MNYPNNKPLLNAGDVMSHFGICRATLTRWHDRGILPKYKIGGVVRYKWDDLLKLLNSGLQNDPHALFNDLGNQEIEIISREELIKKCKTSPGILKRWEREGLIPVYKIGWRNYYKVSHLNLALKEGLIQKVKSGKPGKPGHRKPRVITDDVFLLIKKKWYAGNSIKSISDELGLKYMTVYSRVKRWRATK